MKSSSSNAHAVSPVLKVGYKPNQGFIGQKRVTTSNYLFRTHNDQVESHPYAQGMLDTFLKRSPDEHYIKSELLTEFIRKRGLTFSKKLDNGESRTFTVPVTNSIVPLAKSTFNQLEKNAQSLVMSLRWILQDIYGSKTPEEAPFVQFLPQDMRELFLKTVKESPQYFPQLHHPVMKDYPFFEVVGLDLVLVDDYIRENEALFQKNGQNASDHDLPFKLLELNAGSPSGASNNASVLEGLLEVDPEFARIKERVLPNDHFDILRATFDSIGREWTKDQNGISVILPPGGTNGATPEIHQLAAYSGMPYIEASMLYVDDENNLRLRTLSAENPRVTSIYSRVNADSALYDPEKGIYMRDADDGSPLWQMDSLAAKSEDEKVYIYDKKGNKVPLESCYSIPHAIDLIHARKFYLGGLNRVLDNKLILAVLTHFGPRFYKDKLKELGLFEDSYKLTPPDTLAPHADSLEIIKKTPDDWVVKAPDLSGGSGVHILLTLSDGKKKSVLKEVSKNPTEWAYQKLVKIARIPVATRENGQIRFANLAADIRMWCFWGAGLTFSKPRLTHNGLVRYAPKEKGPLSSIVNTSKGGGYAPLLVIDDIGAPEACSILELTAARMPPAHTVSIPIFVGAQIIQIGRQLRKSLHLLNEPDTTAAALYDLGIGMKNQLNEILSYLSPKNMEPLSAYLTALEKKTQRRRNDKITHSHIQARVKLVETLLNLQEQLPESFFEHLDKLFCLRDDFPLNSQAARHGRQDRARMMALIESTPKNKALREINQRIREISKCHVTESPVTEKSRHELRAMLEAFAELALERLSRDEDRELAYLFSITNLERTDRLEQTYPALYPKVAQDILPPTATQWETAHKKNIIDSPFIRADVREAHHAWHRAKIQVRRLGSHLTKEERKKLLERKREEHFKRFPFLAEIQQLIDQPQTTDVASMWKVIDVLPYAQYNIEYYLKKNNLKREDLFTPEFEHGRVTLINKTQIEQLGLNPYYIGECFARKREKHGLFSNSDLLTWVSKDVSPFILAYTLGHELVHWHQISDLMRAEVDAMNRGSLDFAEFLNFYGNFLGSSVGAVERLDGDTHYRKSLFFGMPDLIASKVKSKKLKNLLAAYRRGDDRFERSLRKSGGLLSWMTPVSSGAQVKAVREVIPCLENAKNIRFAKDLGLNIPLDETKSALPSANTIEIKRYRREIKRAARSSGVQERSLQLIANHQFFGVRVDLEIRACYSPIYMSSSYNSQQQQ